MVRLYVGSYAFIARIPFIKWEAFLTSVERYRTGLAYQILAIVPCKENKRLYSIDGNANPHISYIILHVKHLVAATSALMDRQKIRNLVICWCIHRLVGCLHLEKCFIRRHIPFCGRFHTGLFYEKKLSVIQANFSVEPPMSSHPLNTLKTLLALSTALFVLWDHCFGLPESAFRQCTIFRRELIKTVALPGGVSS